MTPTIHFVRHAQGYHNLSVANQAIRDPLLTPYGEEQCNLLSKTFPYTDSIELIVASPLKRTIYTALLSFPNHKQPPVCIPELQETSDSPCDTGSSKVEIAREFAGMSIDLKLVTDDWNSKKGPWAPQKSAIEERAAAARRWLRSRPEKNIVVVTHGGLLHYLTEDWVGSASLAGMEHPLDHDYGMLSGFTGFAGTGWANTEFRSYTFEQGSGERASLVETQQSRTRRSGNEKPLSEAEQRNLKSSTQAEWEKHGYVSHEKPSEASLKLHAKV